jgi:hypothetical protein
LGKSQPVFAFLPKYAGEAAGGRFFVRKYIFYGVIYETIEYRRSGGNGRHYDAA